MKNDSNRTYDHVYAEHYDILSQHKDYASETFRLDGLITSLLVEDKVPIVDIGCGTGSHCIRLSSLRENPITGFDKSIAMISKAKAKESEIDFVTGDLSSLTEGEYGFAFSLFNVVNCLADTKELTQFFSQVNKILKKDSYFFFECWHHPVVLEDPPKSVTREYSSGDKKFIRLAEADISELEIKKLKLNYQVEIIDGDQAHQVFSTVHHLRLFTVSELHDSLARAGFQVDSCRGTLPELVESISNERMISVLAKKTDNGPLEP